MGGQGVGLRILEIEYYQSWIYSICPFQSMLILGDVIGQANLIWGAFACYKILI